MLARQLQGIGVTIQNGQKAAGTLYASIETNLALAKHAGTSEWKEIQSEVNSSG
jgi:hypothetical protein